MLKITVTKNDWTTKSIKVAGEKSKFEKISSTLHKAQNSGKIKWYMVELLKGEQK